MRKQTSFMSLLGTGLLLTALVLGACGDATSTTVPATTVAATTVAPTTAPVATTAPATTAVATTAPATTQAATTAPATTVATTATQGDFSFTDKLGAKINLSKKAERIVCLSLDCVDWLSELGVLPAGVSKDIAPFISAPQLLGDKASQVALINGTALQPNLEDVAQAKPDLVLSYAAYGETLREALKPIAPLGLFDPRTYQEALDNLKTIGKATGHSSEAEVAATKFLSRLEAYKAKAPKDKTVMVMTQTGDIQTFYINTKETLLCALLNELARCGWDTDAKDANAASFGFASMSVEQILQLDPEVIFVYGYPDQPKTSDLLKDNKIWNALTAVKNKQVYDVYATTWLTNGTRSLNLMLDEAMTTLYPAVFPKALP